MRAPAGAAFGFGTSGGGHGGAVSDLVAVPAADHLLVACPDNLAPEVACTLSDNVADAYRAVVPQLDERPGADVLVLGGTAASIGLYAVGLAVASGAGTVRYVDSDPARLVAAERLGAAVEEHDGPWPRRLARAQVVVDNTGDPDGLTTALRSTDDFGACTSVVIHFDPMTAVPLLEMYSRGVRLTSSRVDSRALIGDVVALVTSGVFDPAAVPTTVVSWDEADRAWPEPAIKLVVSRSAG
jgi:alcohol dehydrogenase